MCKPFILPLESQITNQRRYRSWKRKSIVTAGKTWLENPKKWNEERRWKESSRLTFVSLGFCWLMLRLTRSFFYAFMLAVTSGSPSKKPEEKAFLLKDLFPRSTNEWWSGPLVHSCDGWSDRCKDTANTKVKRTSLRPKKTNFCSNGILHNGPFNIPFICLHSCVAQLLGNGKRIISKL